MAIVWVGERILLYSLKTVLARQVEKKGERGDRRAPPLSTCTFKSGPLNAIAAHLRFLAPVASQAYDETPSALDLRGPTFLPSSTCRSLRVRRHKGASRLNLAPVRLEPACVHF